MSDYPMLISNKLHSFRNFPIAKICGKSGTAKKHSESVKNQRVLKIKTLWLVSHSKLWLVIRL